MYRGLTGRIASALNANVYVPHYRQAPDFPFPTPVDGGLTAYRALLDKGIDPVTLVRVGDSAGRARGVTLMRKARDAGLPLPAAAVAFSPWADLTHSGVAARACGGLDPLCSLDFLHRLARHFLAGELPTHPDASPVYADLQGLSPTLIQMGENEVMLSGAMILATRLGEARVRTTLEVWPGMFHVWHRLAGTLPEADQALHNAIGCLKNALSTQAGTHDASRSISR